MAAQQARTRPAPEVRRLTAHLGIGGVSLATDLAVLVALRQSGLALLTATTAAYAVSVLVNFALNRRLHGQQPLLSPGPLRRYLLVLVANYLVTVTVMDQAQHRGLPYVTVKLAVVGMLAGWNYPLYRRWVFAPSSRPRPGCR